MKLNNIFVLLLTLITACQSEVKNEKQENKKLPEIVELTENQYKSAQIQTGKMEEKPFSTQIKVSGQVEVPPQNEISISLALGAFVKETSLLPGMKVHVGQVLAIVEDQQFIQLQQDYLSAKVQFQTHDLELQRQKKLNENKASSDKVLEQASLNFQMTQIQMKSLEEKLKLIGIQPQHLTVENISKSVKILSPIQGFVSSVHVNVGKYVQAGEMMFGLVNPSDVHLRLTVFEKDIPYLAVGQKLKAWTNSDPDKKYPCQIILVSKQMNKENSTEVHCHFDQIQSHLLPGMYMNAEIELNDSKSNTLPEESIVRFENKNYIFIELGPKKYKMQEVHVGVSHEGLVAILDAESFKNEPIVTKGAYSLLMSLKNTED